MGKKANSKRTVIEFEVLKDGASNTNSSDANTSKAQVDKHRQVQKGSVYLAHLPPCKEPEEGAEGSVTI